MQPKDPEVSIIVVSYNTRELTLACLESVFRETERPSFEVLVVDNGSEDGSPEAIAERFPQVLLLRSSENLGFARANNLAAARARGRYLLLLNPDTVVLDRAIEKLYDFARSLGGRAICGGRTVQPDGTLNPSSCWARPTLWSTLAFAFGLSSVFRRSRWFNPEAMPHWHRDTVRKVDIVTGCFFLIPRALWEELGGFDPDFFMYAEEADLCLRAAKAGVDCWIYPPATIVHMGGASEKERGPRIAKLFAAKRRLFRKHWPSGHAKLGSWLLKLAILNRVLVGGLLGIVRAKARRAFWDWLGAWKHWDRTGS